MQVQNSSNSTISQHPMLLSLSILHRHGARRPSPSEISQWAESAAIRTQWPTNELGSLTELGRKMGEQLGAWFAAVAVKSIGKERLKRDGACWRSSSSKRGRESGQNFVDGFNRNFGLINNDRIGSNIASEEKLLSGPQEYPGSQDLYFRPWLPMKSELDAVNANTRASPAHLAIAKENKAFLELLNDASKMKPLPASKTSLGPEVLLEHMLWETSHVFAALKCEIYWASALTHGMCDSRKLVAATETTSHYLATSSSSSLNTSPMTSPLRGAHHSNASFASGSNSNHNSDSITASLIDMHLDKRNLLTEQVLSCVPDMTEFESKLEELACYVWTCRHLAHPLVKSVGKLTLSHFLGDILDGNKAMNVFSGHDYTIMVLLSAWGLMPPLKQHLGFCSFVTFELWSAASEEDLPEFSTNGYDSTLNSNESENPAGSRFLRVCINWFPFTPQDPMQVDCSQYEVLGVFSEEALRKMIDELN